MNPQSPSSSLFAECNNREECNWKALDHACELLNVQAGTFFELDAEKRSLRVAHTFGVLPWRVAKGQFPCTQGICGWVCQHNEPAIVNKVSTDKRFNRQIDLITQFKTMSVLCAPVTIAGKVQGVIELINRHEQPFTPEDLTQLQGLIQAAVSRLKELPQ